MVPPKIWGQVFQRHYLESKICGNILLSHVMCVILCTQCILSTVRKIEPRIWYVQKNYEYQVISFRKYMTTSFLSMAFNNVSCALTLLASKAMDIFSET